MNKKQNRNKLPNDAAKKTVGNYQNSANSYQNTPKHTEIALKGKPTVSIEQIVLDKVKHLCSESPKEEWSGIIVYTMNGEMSDPSNMEINVLDLYPMDFGSEGFTSYEFNENIAQFYKAYPQHLGGGKMLGHMHSHNDMGVYFSATDNQALQEGAEANSFFLSIIVNNKMEIVGKIVSLGDITSYDKEGGQQTVNKVMLAADLDFKTGDLPEIEDESFHEKVKALKEEKEKARQQAAKWPKRYPNTYGYPNQNSIWDDVDDYYPYNTGKSQTTNVVNDDLENNALKVLKSVTNIYSDNVLYQLERKFMSDEQIKNGLSRAEDFDIAGIKTNSPSKTVDILYEVISILSDSRYYANKGEDETHEKILKIIRHKLKDTLFDMIMQHVTNECDLAVQVRDMEYKESTTEDMWEIIEGPATQIITVEELKNKISNLNLEKAND